MLNNKEPERYEQRANKYSFSLLATLREQKAMQLKGDIYHRTQIDQTYNFNHIEGSQLSHEQTRYIFETNTIGITDDAVTDTCLTAQDQYKASLNYFRIKYD